MRHPTVRYRVERLGAITATVLRMISWWFTVISGLGASLAAFDLVAIYTSRWLEARWGLDHFVEAVFIGFLAGILAAIPFVWGVWRLYRSAFPKWSPRRQKGV